jgi:hypothetical protein
MYMHSNKFFVENDNLYIIQLTELLVVVRSMFCNIYIVSEELLSHH